MYVCVGMHVCTHMYVVYACLLSGMYFWASRCRLCVYSPAMKAKACTFHVDSIDYDTFGVGGTR